MGKKSTELVSMPIDEIVTELNKGEKLNGDNYDIWHRKVQYVIEEQEALETLNNIMLEPERGNIAQHKGTLKPIMLGKGRTTWLALRC